MAIASHSPAVMERPIAAAGIAKIPACRPARGLLCLSRRNHTDRAMTIFGSINTAVEALNAFSVKIGNISDNVANASTVGYKTVDTQFSDLVDRKSTRLNSSH